jgi:aminocarboxymuconate-semialdehyde decarboxylase
MDAIDMHAHWSPRGLVRQSAAGKDWYGWRVFKDATGREHIALGERILAFAASTSLMDDPAARAEMRRRDEGIGFQARMLTGTFFNYHLDETAAAAFCREVNEEVADIQRAFPDRYAGIAILPMQHAKLAEAVLEDAIGRLGLKAVMIASNVRGLNLDEPTVTPILEAIARAGVPLFVHPVIWGKAGEDRFPRYHFWNSFGAPLESSLAAMSMVYSGILDRHPGMKVMFTQGGGWIHFGVGRLNLRYDQRADARPMAHPPVEYLSRLYFDCLVHDLDSLRLLVTRAGADHVFVGTDYPARGDIPGGAAKWIAAADFLSPGDKEKILYRNAATFLGLPGAP